MPATVDLSAAEIELVGDERRAFRLREAFAALTRPYDYILIDCPPSLGVLTVNALAAAHAVLVPLQCEFFALEGLSLLCARSSGCAAASTRCCRCTASC